MTKTYTRFIAAMVFAGLAQWSLAMGWITGQHWMAVLMVAAGGFGLAKSAEHYKPNGK